MDRLFSPWRSQYIASFKRTQPENQDCLFCAALQQRKDEANLVVARGRKCFVMLNLYPYNSGHVMVIPCRHISSLSELSAAENAEVLALTSRVMEALRKIMSPHGYNFGANLGRAAGAGIDQHIHFHLVPRWNGDTNFMPVLADTKLVSEDLKRTYRRLRAALSRKKRKH